MLPKEWTGDLVRLMHINRITNKMLAEHMGITDRYVCMVLNGEREPANAEAKFREALKSLIAQRNTA